MAMSKTAKQLAATLAIGLTLRFVLTKAGWHPPSLAGNRILPALVLWVIFGICREWPGRGRTCFNG